MRRDGVDSDGDGAKDLDELSWGGDPNTPDLPATPAEQRPVEAYGCVRVARAEPTAIGWTTALAAACWLLRARRRRSTRH